MKHIMTIEKNKDVMTPDGRATVVHIDWDSSAVRVKHLEAKTPITDYRFSDLQPVPSEHTPAPWHIDCRDSAIKEHTGYWPIITPEGELIALVNLQECNIPYNQQCANVKAIAVAGEMLDILKELIESIDPKVVEKNNSIPGVEMTNYIANKSIPSDKSIKAALSIIKKATT